MLYILYINSPESDVSICSLLYIINFYMFVLRLCNDSPFELLCQRQVLRYYLLTFLNSLMFSLLDVMLLDVSPFQVVLLHSSAAKGGWQNR